MQEFEFLAAALLERRDKGGLVVECYKRGMRGAFRLLVEHAVGEERREKLHHMALKKKDLETTEFLVSRCVFPTGASLVAAARAANLEAVRLFVASPAEFSLADMEDALEDACLAFTDTCPERADTCADEIDRARRQRYGDARDVDHERSLFRACRNCDLVAVRELLKFASFPRLERAVAEVCTCTKRCADAGAIVALLHEEGANVRYVNEQGATLLSLCYNSESTEALLALGCKPTARDVATVFDNRLIPHAARSRMMRAMTQ